MGVCKLTGRTGPFVRSHLIPKALTKPEEPGLPLMQRGSGRHAIKRWTSWYDKGIVTREGEDILSSLDTWAIAFLREQHLVWSGWGPRAELGNLHNQVPGTHFGLRIIENYDGDKFRLFVLSLLWRSAISRLEEFSEINLPESDIEKIRKVLVSGDLPEIDFYPSTVIQLSTMGMIHNMTPIRQIKDIPSVRGTPEFSIPIIRFYFDGMVLHIHDHAQDDGYTESLGKMIVGNEKELAVTTVTYERSFQLENLRFIAAESLS